jgi:hypothetical protein
MIATVRDSRSAARQSAPARRYCRPLGRPIAETLRCHQQPGTTTRAWTQPRPKDPADLHRLHRTDSLSGCPKGLKRGNASSRYQNAVLLLVQLYNSIVAAVTFYGGQYVTGSPPSQASRRLGLVLTTIVRRQRQYPTTNKLLFGRTEVGYGKQACPTPTCTHSRDYVD